MPDLAMQCLRVGGTWGQGMGLLVGTEGFSTCGCLSRPPALRVHHRCVSPHPRPSPTSIAFASSPSHPVLPIPPRPPRPSPHHPHSCTMASPMAFVTAAPFLSGAAASRARAVGVAPRRASALPTRAARRSPTTGVSMVGGSLNDLLSNNLEWSKHMTSDDPDYFKNLVAMQQPDYLWIGCTFRVERMIGGVTVNLYMRSLNRLAIMTWYATLWWLCLTSPLSLLFLFVLIDVHGLCAQSVAHSQAPILECQPMSSSACHRVLFSCTATLPMWSHTQYVLFGCL